jgi:hypothetical protein
MAQDSLGRDRPKDAISRYTLVSVRLSTAILAAMRDASCRASPSLTEDRRDVAPPIEAPQPDLTAGHETEEEDQRRVLGR